MKHCERCLYPENHGLGLTFDSEGICSGCRIHEEKDVLDWRERENELRRLVSEFQGQHESYDCVVPVQGTGDDFFVVNYLKEKLSLNPLLVTYNSHFNTKVGIRNLARLVSVTDCDHMMSTVGPDTVRKITRETLKLRGDMYWHVLAGNQTFPVQVAVKMKIPLIVWGVNGWLDQVGMYSHCDSVEMTKRARYEHSLRALETDTLALNSEQLSEQDLVMYRYPEDHEIQKEGVRGIYLGNYVRWDSKAQVELAIKNWGFETALQERTYNTYESIHCINNASVHDYLKYLKLGYAKVNDHVARDIRFGRMTKETGIALINKYLPIKPKALSTFLDWLNLSEAELLSYINPFRDRRAWQLAENGTWLPCAGSFGRLETGSWSTRDQDLHIEPYEETPLMEEQTFSDQYILMGRTYLDSRNFRAVEG